MSGRNCPQCNYILSDKDTSCPLCGKALEKQTAVQVSSLSQLDSSQLRALFKEGKTNKELLASLSKEQKRQAYIFADLNGGKFPWEVSPDDEEPEMPQMEIIYPEDYSPPPSQQMCVDPPRTSDPPTSQKSSNSQNVPYQSHSQPKPKKTKKPLRRPNISYTLWKLKRAIKSAITKKDRVSVILMLLSFFMPLVGIFYFFSAKDYRPRKAKFTLVAGIIGLVSCVAITVLIEMSLVPEEIYSAVFGGILGLFR